MSPRHRSYWLALQLRSATAPPRIRCSWLRSASESRLVFGVLLLMVSRVDLGASSLIVASAPALGLAIALPAWRRAPYPATDKLKFNGFPDFSESEAGWSTPRANQLASNE